MAMQGLKRKVLSKKEIKELIKKLPSMLESLINKKDIVEVIKIKKDNIFLVNHKPYFIETNNRIIPHLQLILDKKILIKEVIVDQGAIKPILNGADVMAPGIVFFNQEIEKDDLVCVCDRSKRLPLCVGYSLLSAEEFLQLKEKKGRVIKNVHHLKDIWWNLFK